MTLRRPTEEEQQVIVAVNKAVDRLRSVKVEPVAIGMGLNVIEDKQHGRWTTILGLPVVEIRDGHGLAADIVVMTKVQL